MVPKIFFTGNCVIRQCSDASGPHCVRTTFAYAN